MSPPFSQSTGVRNGCDSLWLSSILSSAFTSLNGTAGPLAAAGAAPAAGAVVSGTPDSSASFFSNSASIRSASAYTGLSGGLYLSALPHTSRTSRMKSSTDEYPLLSSFFSIVPRSIGSVTIVW